MPTMSWQPLKVWQLRRGGPILSHGHYVMVQGDIALIMVSFRSKNCELFTTVPYHPEGYNSFCFVAEEYSRLTSQDGGYTEIMFPDFYNWRVWTCDDHFRYDWRATLTRGLI